MLLLFVLVVFFVGVFLCYYQFFYHSPIVKNTIFKPLNTITFHHSDVWTAKFSPNGRLIASASVDSSVKIWDKESKQLTVSLRHPIGVTYATFSKDGQYLVTGCYDGIVRLWELPAGKLIREFKGHAKTVWTVDISPDNKTIVSGSEDAKINMWDAGSGDLIRSLSDHSLTVWDVKFNPDGTQFAAGSYDGTITIYQTITGKLLKALKGHTQAVVSIAYSHKGDILSSTSDDCSTRLWSTNDWSQIRSFSVPEHVQAVVFSPDDNFLVTGGRDKPAIGEFLQNFFGDSKYNKGISMRLWRVNSGELLQTFSYHTNDVNDVDWSSDGKYVCSASSDKTVVVWARQD